MTTSPATVLRRLLHGLATLSLSEHVVGRLLGLAAVGGTLAGLALLALGPPGALSVFHFQTSPSPIEQGEILRRWAESGFQARVLAHLAIDAFVLAPLLLLGLLALGMRLNHLWRLDHPGEPGRPVKLALWLSAAVAVLAFMFGLAADVLTAILLQPGDRAVWPGAVRWMATVRVAGVAVLGIAATLVLARWYFMTAAEGAEKIVQGRARLRAGVADILWRSKYATAVVIAFSALAIIMDQTRDALLRQSTDAAEAAGPMSVLLGYVITALAVLALAYASWIWPRQLVRLKTPGRDAEPTRQEVTFAKWWCRILGMLPFLAVGIALSLTVREQPLASLATRALVWFSIANAMLALLFLVSIVFRRREVDTPYYLSADDWGDARADLALRSVLVACGAPAVFLLARFASLIGWAPPLALAVIASGLAAWAALLGWVAYQARRNAVPYLLGVILIVAVLGIFGWAEVHLIRADIGAADGSEFSAASQFLSTVLLALPCLWLGWWLSRREPTFARLLLPLAAAALPIVLVLVAYDRPLRPQMRDRLSLEQATVNWVNALPLASAPDGPPYPVYIISAEGGGIRAAYWTAAILARLKQLDPQFDRRTLAISGVSGGALGIAAFRACELESMPTPDRLFACVQRFGATDFWTQLLGGILFEDALGSVLPTSLFCSSPGCRVLGRSYWFEGTMEESLPRMATGLIASTSEAPLPHLFLTTTRVETGERWIQSDLAIDYKTFPGACDVLAMLGSDLRLSTAAHNSSRFPYTNPVGALFGRPCLPDSTEVPGTGVLRARLQDGGYFDDSAASTSADVLRALRRCLRVTCEGMRTDLASKQPIRPVVITIRNEARFEAEPDDDAAHACEAKAKRDPARPKTVGPLRLLPSILSSGYTSLMTREAHMYAAEAQLEAESEALWRDLRRGPATASSSEASPKPCIPFHGWAEEHSSRRFDLLSDAALYPSGWMLSRAAIQGIDAQVDRYLGKAP